MLYKASKFELRAADENTFEGYASKFGNTDFHGDVIMKGAFAKTLKENANRVKILWQHRMDMPIGKPVEMYEDDNGLYVKGKLSMTDLGKNALTLIKDGVIDEMSIGFDIIKEDYSQGVRLIKEVRLWEFSPVTFAANDQAKITGVKDLNELMYQVKNSDNIVIEQAITYLKSLIEPTAVTQKEQDEKEVRELLDAIKKIKQ